MTVPDNGGLKKRQTQRQFLLTNGRNQQNSEMGKRGAKAKSLILGNIPEPLCFVWIGEVEDAQSIDDLITSASISGEPILDFENLDFKSTRGVRKILKGNVKKQVTTAERKAQSEKRLLTGRQIAWMIFDFLNISGDNEAILEFKDLSKVKERQRSSLRHRVGRCIISITDRLTDNISESLSRMHI